MVISVAESAISSPMPHDSGRPLDEDGDVATYVAFLRGVNLGPNNKISMPELRAMAEDLGFTDVATYINSGNLIISSHEEGGDRGAGDLQGDQGHLRPPDRCHGADTGSTEEDPGREPLSGRQPQSGNGGLPDQGASQGRQGQGGRSRRRTTNPSPSPASRSMSTTRKASERASWRRSSAPSSA